MIKRILLGLLVVIIAAGTWGWFNKSQVLLFAASHMGKHDVAENKPVVWQKGPDSPALPADKRPRRRRRSRCR